MDSSGTSAATSATGAISLLDKYAAINSSIEDTRRRVTEVRSNLEQCNIKILTLVEERNGMEAENEQANKDKSRLLTELKEAEKLYQAKMMENERVQSDQRLAKSEYDKMRRFIEDERMEFLEHCREFRSSCKRLRVASSILVLGGGVGGERELNENDMANEGGLWRRLQEEDFSDRSTSNEDAKDFELELAEKSDKESKKVLTEIEAAIHAERMKFDDAVQRSNARNQRLTQQRAQLQRHRKEVENLECEIQSMKNNIDEENQLAYTYEKECTRKKNALNNTTLLNIHHTPTTEPSSGPKQGGVVPNPYNKQANRKTPTLNAPQTQNGDKNMQSGEGGNIVLPYASVISHGITPELHQGRRNSERTTQQQQPHHGGYVRNQRQFGTSVGISIDSGAMNESISSTKYTTANTDDSESDVSSASSDEDILSFNIFGKK